MFVKGGPSYVEVGLSGEQVARELWGFEQSQSREGGVMGVANVVEIQTCLVGEN